MRGRIVKGVGGFYDVDTEQGIYRCRARGVFKKENLTPTVGDEVDMEVTHEGDREGVVLRIYPRKNLFIRPPISNVDTVVVVVAAKDADPSLLLIDKIRNEIVKAHEQDVDLILCVNKVDLVTEDELEPFRRIYEPLYPVLYVSAGKGEGIRDLKDAAAGKRVALAGPSGVGKSTILNLLHEEADAETGTVSGKTGRGRHTTRHVEIFAMDNGGLLYDTPGFTSLDPPDMEEQELAYYFPEMRDLLGGCRFDDCRHLKEPDCAVTAAVEAGTIARERYENYVLLMEELRAKDPYA